MIRYSRSSLARAFVHLHVRYPIRPLVQTLARELLTSHRTVDLDSVVGEIARHMLDVRKIVLAQVTSARPLSKTTVQHIKDILCRATGASAVRLDEKVDPDIIGGCIVRTPGLELDASVASSLKSLIVI